MTEHGSSDPTHAQAGPPVEEGASPGRALRGPGAPGHPLWRRPAAIGVALAVVALGAVGVWSALRGGVGTGLPAATPSVTMVGSASPNWTPAASGTPGGATTTSAGATASRLPGVPGRTGTLPEGFTLRHQGVGPTGDATGWEPDIFTVGCGRAADLPSLDRLEASLNLVRLAPEEGRTETILVFASEPDAQAFMAELLVESDCEPITSAEDAGLREVFAAGALPGLGDEALSTRSWFEQDIDGVWTPRPGGALRLVARAGRAVTMAGFGGETVGDPISQTALVADLRASLDHALPQMCVWTDAGC